MKKKWLAPLLVIKNIKIKISSLYTHPKASCFVSLTRGEGFGLPLLEAAASGLPIIATEWSGHLDFLKDKFIKVDYNLKNIDKSRIDNRIFVENTKWAEIVESSYKRAMLDAYANIGVHEKVSKSLRKETKIEYSKENNKTRESESKPLSAATKEEETSVKESTEEPVKGKSELPTE